MTCRDCEAPRHGHSELETLACHIRWVVALKKLAPELEGALARAASMIDEAAEEHAVDAWGAHAERADSKGW